MKFIIIYSETFSSEDGFLLLLLSLSFFCVQISFCCIYGEFFSLLFFFHYSSFHILMTRFGFFSVRFRKKWTRDRDRNRILLLCLKRKSYLMTLEKKNPKIIDSQFIHTYNWSSRANLNVKGSKDL